MLIVNTMALLWQERRTANIVKVSFLSCTKQASGVMSNNNKHNNEYCIPLY